MDCEGVDGCIIVFWIFLIILPTCSMNSVETMHLVIRESVDYVGMAPADAQYAKAV